MGRSTGLAGPEGATADTPHLTATARDGDPEGPERSPGPGDRAGRPGPGARYEPTAPPGDRAREPSGTPGEPRPADVPDAPDPYREAVERVGATLEAVFAVVAGTGDDTAALLSDAARTGRAPRSADLAPLRPGLRDRLGRHPLVSGVGFVAAPGLLDDVPGWLEWWQRGPDGTTRPLLLDLDPGHTAYSDYTHWDWYTLPRDTGRRTVAGPYVDYLCSDEYGLTLSVPVVLDGAFAGVAAADVYLRHFEAAVLPELQRLPAPARLVSARGRVAASTDPAHLAGSLTRGPDTAAALAGPPSGHRADGLRLLPCAGTPFVLVTAED
ncbi:cache domain-containing protein [Streptomyces sp. NPDC094049]|uniref:cache domain-containing protein n=1 Tax=Streptomyces sp. NPDC094049 TaxID=3154987 RepID=UPI00332EF95C